MEVTGLNKTVKSGASCTVVESVKTTADVYAPADGKVVTANQSLVLSPQIANQQPETDNTWMFEI